MTEPPRCPHCLDDGEVCESHPEFPAHVKVEGHDGTRCGAGMPCPACCSEIPQDGARSIAEAFTPDWLRAKPAVHGASGLEVLKARAEGGDAEAGPTGDLYHIES